MSDPIGGPSSICPTEADPRTGSLTVRNLGQAQTLPLTITPRQAPPSDHRPEPSPPRVPLGAAADAPAPHLQLRTDEP